MCIRDRLWADAPEQETPNERTIDVHVRRLRVKLAHYQDIVRTVRGTGYRFDRHADVSILHAATPVSYTHLDVYKRQERGYTIRMFGNETDARVWLRYGSD